MSISATPESSGEADRVDVLSNFTDDQQLHLKPWDTSDPNFSYHTRILMQQILKCYVRQVIVFIGIPGNVLCCVVFFKQGLSDQINLLLFCLAVVDCSSLLSQLLLMPGCYMSDRVAIDNWAVVLDTKVSNVSWWLGHLSGILIVVVSLHRCLSVALPLRAKRLISYRATVAAIVLSYLLSLLVFLPCFLAFTVQWTTDPATNRSIAYAADASWFPLTSTQALDIIYYSFSITLPVFLCIMIVCCTITIIHLRKASRQREKMTGTGTDEGKSGQQRITVMLLTSCVVYMVLALFETAYSIVSMVVPGLHVYQKYHNTTIVIYQFTWIATCFNSAINFFVYVLLSTRFRKTLKDCLLSLCRCRGK